MHRFPLCVLFLSVLQISVSGQNIGINQPNPEWPLDVLAPHAAIKLTTTNSPFGSILELKNLYTPTDYLGAINFNDPASSYPGQIGYRSNHAMTFRVGGFERMRIDNNGHLGIGTLIPTHEIDIHAVGASMRILNSSTGAVLVLETSHPGSSTYGALNFSGPGNGGQIRYDADQSLNFNVNGFVDLKIYQGRIGLGRTAITNKLEVEGNASKFTAGDWLANSDLRLKKNITPLNSTEMLERILALQGVTYEWNDDKTGSARPEGIQFGFTAQNVQQAFPSLVEPDNLGYLQTAYGTYDPMFVEALRALNDKLLKLEAENALLKTENAGMKADINEIRVLLNHKQSSKLQP